LPVSVYSLVSFRPTSPAAFAKAQSILVDFRIPHHCRPDWWLDEVAVFQTGWMILGLALAWRTRLFAVLAVPLLLSALLTLAQAVSGSHALALLFPWRVSAVLVPVVTAVILSRLVAIPLSMKKVGAWGEESTIAPRFLAVVFSGCLLLLMVLAAVGLWISFGRQAFHTSDEEVAVMEFVRQSKRPGDVYFLPVRVRDPVKTTRGSLSSDFKPLAEKRQDERVIPVDLQRFRLHTGAPIFVDFKSIPYPDAEVIEWRDRLHLAEKVQEQIEQGQLQEALTALQRRGVTHLLQPATQELTEPRLQQVYEDEWYRVYRLIPVADGE
jgi:hypothetical protein